VDSRRPTTILLTPLPVRGFTLVELLVVIAIIGILAALMLPVLRVVILKSKISKAKMEIASIVGGITAYELAYGRPPVSSAALRSLVPDGAAKPACPDFTFGTVNLNPQTGGDYVLTNRYGVALPAIANTGNTAAGTPAYQNSNAEVMGILMDWTVYRDQNPTANVNHTLNQMRRIFLDAPQVSDIDVAGMAEAEPGIGIDGVYRDPWGNPYMITLDMNADGRCRDAFYRRSKVAFLKGATGYDGLFDYVDPTGLSDDFEANAAVMVWSLGPDGQADPAASANAGFNKDNILSWQ
jgi:prepilin-type N-terminal cleavage/methylation domain-containing protein